MVGASSSSQVTHALAAPSACLRVLCAWALLAAGCGGLTEVPSEGGPAWLRVEGKSFTLYTDQERNSAIGSLRELEHLLSAFLQLGWEAKGKPPGRLSVVLFADESDFRELAGPDVDGTYHAEILLDPWLVSYASTRPGRFALLVHELTHHIAYLAIDNQPAWFAEGIATFFETAHFDASGNFVVGAVPRRVAQVLERRRMPAQQLLAADVDTRSPVFGATAWLLVHYLMMEHANAFAEYQRALAAGADADLAWSTAFGAQLRSELDTRLSAYATDGVFEGTRRRVERPSVLAHVQTLGDADVHALRAQLFLTCQDCGDAASREQRARRELDDALRADPDHLWANGLALSYLTESPTQRLPSAEHLVQAHPDAALAWVLQARALRDGGASAEGVREAADHALALAPEHPAVMMLAAEASVPGDPERALRLSEDALRRRPGDARMLATRGSVLHAAGRCEELRALHARARQLPHRRDDVLRTLSELAASCTAREPTPAPRSTEPTSPPPAEAAPAPAAEPTTGTSAATPGGPQAPATAPTTRAAP